MPNTRRFFFDKRKWRERRYNWYVTMLKVLCNEDVLLGVHFQWDSMIKNLLLSMARNCPGLEIKTSFRFAPTENSSFTGNKLFIYLLLDRYNSQ